MYGDDAADSLLKQDGFEYGCIQTCGDPLDGYYSITDPELVDWGAIVAGTRTGGSGSYILELKYGKDQADNLLFEKGVTAVDHFFFQIWFKTSVGWDPSSHRGDGIKGFMFPHDGTGTRYQIGLSRLKPDPASNCSEAGPRWPETHWGNPGREEQGGVKCNYYVWEGRASDNEGPPWSNTHPSSPWPNGFNDGNWHRVTIEIQAVGADQYVKFWLDGILAWDDSGQGHDYPRPGYIVKAFGNFADIPDTTAENGSIFFDDMTVWKR
jgi:hypothetical protein